MQDAGLDPFEFKHKRPIKVSIEHKVQIMKQIRDDVLFFCENEVMDYSMFICRGAKPPQPSGLHALHAVPCSDLVDGFPTEFYYFAIIDVSQQYTAGKAVEQWLKVSLLRKDKYAVSSSAPGYYGKRFVERMNEYILSEPEMKDDPDGSTFMAELEDIKWHQYDTYKCCCCCKKC